MSEAQTPVDTSEKPAMPPKAPAKKAPAKAKPPKKKAAAPLQMPPALTPEEAEPGTVQHKHRVKIAKELAKQKAEKKVTEFWVEHSPNKASKKGGKVILAQRTNSGVVHRTLVGFSKGLTDYLAQAKAEGKLRIV